MPTKDVSSDVEELTSRVAELERRLSLLEGSKLTLPAASASSVSPMVESTTSAAQHSTSPQTNAFSAFGTGVLGIGGAYLLRAAAESGILKLLFAAALSLAYAAGWMVAASLRGTRSQIARLAYAATGALILLPMLWEVTVRFRLVKPATTALCLIGFAIFIICLARAKNAPVTAWIGTLTAIIGSLMLMVATRDLLPFTGALLAMAIAVEITSGERRWPGLRPVAAMAADVAVAIVIIIIGDPAAVPSEYRTVPLAILIALGAAVFVIYAAALAFRSIFFGLRITAFAAAQFTAATSLLTWLVLRATHGSGRLALGVASLLIGMVAYFVAFGTSAGRSQRANFNFYAICSLGFVIAGSFLSLSKVPLAIWFCLAAILSAALGDRWSNSSLQTHSIAYLCGGVAASGLLGYIVYSFAGANTPRLALLPILSIASAALFNVLIQSGCQSALAQRLLRIVPVLLTAYGAAAVTIVVLAPAEPAPSRLSLIRTMVACATALALTFIGARWKRTELVWIGYVTVGLGSVKLIFEDLPFGTTETLAASFVVYGAVLIIIPRVVRWGRTRRPSTA